MRAGFLGVLTMAGCCFAISPPSRAQTNDMIFANFKQSFCTKMGDADLNRLCQASKSREDLKSKIADWGSGPCAANARKVSDPESGVDVSADCVNKIQLGYSTVDAYFSGAISNHCAGQTTGNQGQPYQVKSVKTVP
jgi:hypothetical protein